VTKTITFRTCNICGEEKPLARFAVNNDDRTHDAQRTCKGCRKAYNRGYRAAGRAQAKIPLPVPATSLVKDGVVAVTTTESISGAPSLPFQGRAAARMDDGQLTLGLP
jgi:hypothetical protein